MHAPVNAGYIYLANHVPEAGEVVGGESHVTGDGIRHVISSEKCRKRVHEGLRRAAVVGGILGMSRGWVEWNPVGVGNRVRISVGVRVDDGSVGPPESEVILRVHAGGNGIGESNVGHGR